MSRTIIVGGGISGLTAACFLASEKHQVTLIEKSDKLGGLVSSYNYKGFVIDGGIRSTENSGILFPMLRQLGIDLEFVKSDVTLGVKEDLIKISNQSDVESYKALLFRQFPEEKKALELIFKDIYMFMGFMDVLYGIDNPLFLNPIKDRKYFLKHIFPWLFKFVFTVGKLNKYKMPVNTYLEQYTSNKTLIDLIAQHFFQDTPVIFALSYFSLYIDYYYPLGGTGKIIDELESYAISHQVKIVKNTMIDHIDYGLQEVYDMAHQAYPYDYLIWSANAKSLYQKIDVNSVSKESLKRKLIQQRDQLKNLKGGDSVFTTYLFVNLNSSYFEKITTGHLFYTPVAENLLNLTNLIRLCQNQSKEVVIQQLKHYLRSTTYEISIPVLRDSSLAPQGQTALIVSVLMDYDLVKTILDQGWVDEMNELFYQTMLEVLNQTVFPDLKNHVFDYFTSSPVSIQERVLTENGAITGWAFTNASNPSTDRIIKVASSVKTIFPMILQTGQWAYTPAGLPTGIMTGKLAANYVNKRIKK